MIVSYQQKPGGQKQRFAPGNWERATNRQQRRLTRAFDQWSSATRKKLVHAASRGAPISEQTGILEASLPELQVNLQKIVEKGVTSAAKVAAGDRADSPEIKALTERHASDSRQMIALALIPAIHVRLLPEIARGAAYDSKMLRTAFMAVRSAPSQYAGGYWVMIFDTQRTLGKKRELERISEGKPIEEVRWILDPRAEHCKPSPGFYGCPELAGAYPRGWNSLPTVPAGQVTCRGNCLLPGSAVDTETIEAAFRMPYNGPALELITQSGMRLSVTPGHPILTSRGWIAAQFLHEGDTVISGGFTNGMSMIQEDNEYMPSRIDEIWNALSIEGSQAYPSDFSIVPNEFHGDGRFMDGKIDVIWPGSELWSKINTALSQIDSKFPLISGFLGARMGFGLGATRQFYQSSVTAFHRFMIGSDLMNPLFWRHLTPLKGLSFASASDVDIMEYQKTANSPAAEIERQRDGVLRIPSLVSGNDVNRNNDLSIRSPRQPQTLSVASGLDPFGLEEFTQGEAAYARILSQFADSLTGQIALDQIIEVRRFDYSGHVYDLQTERGFYFASTISQRQGEGKLKGILAHNCRCHLEVKRDGKWQRGIYGD